MLDEIGFYTLYDRRAQTASDTSPLIRAEMILLGSCNFRCPYCRGLPQDANRQLGWEDIKTNLSHWFRDGLQNVRFSGGEPTLHPHLKDAVKLCADNGVRRIAISTNGSASASKYDNLLGAGVNDISVSLDACCVATGDKMSGRKGVWKKVVENIQYLSTKSYTTVGIVLTDENVAQQIDTVLFAHDLGVSDIRIIPAAQYSQRNMKELAKIPGYVLNVHPILKYRVLRALEVKCVRGISQSDTHKCALVLDDSVMAGSHHYPCIIYLREGGRAIGNIGVSMRKQRKFWYENHNSYEDRICRRNCLDVCVAYNNYYADFRNTEKCLIKKN